MSTPDQIREALAKLDPGTDDHWTADGQPRLGVVSELIGDGGTTTRKEIVDAAPDFSRAHAQMAPVEPAYDPAAEKAANSEAKSRTAEIDDEIVELDSRIDALRASRLKLQAERDVIVQERARNPANANIHAIKRYLEQAKQLRRSRKGPASTAPRAPVKSAVSG